MRFFPIFPSTLALLLTMEARNIHSNKHDKEEEEGDMMVIDGHGASHANGHNNGASNGISASSSFSPGSPHYFQDGMFGANKSTAAVEERPTALDTTEVRFLEVSKDKLTAKYTGRGVHPHDVGVKTSFFSIFPLLWNSMPWARKSVSHLLSLASLFLFSGHSRQ